ncbi:efflux RND transporter permease subunit [Salinivibrio kushneri]|uniref:efflux RND transporter permease subunit n=1 Tax=Salinivibrio kushneri TaxID=1908198 RepID=UPI0009898246|nr:efflux RND transporter permease subunit [Salinivibrio kushneri]OOE64533.1 acriflavine resistance protein B [Salinivibrio kushneri]
MRDAQPQGQLITRVMNSFFPPILIVLALLVGAAALWLTPKEEDPQIVVPMADIVVQAPGLSAPQVAKQVTQPLEKKVSQIDGVEYVYSTTQAGSALVTVRFYVGEDRESALVKLYNKLYANQDAIPAAVSEWAIKPVEIDDVPIVIAALRSDKPDQLDHYALRRIAEQATLDLKALPETNAVKVVGGVPRQVLVTLDPAAMASYQISVSDLTNAFSLSHQKRDIGDIQHQGERYLLKTGQWYQSLEEIRHLVVAVVNGKPVYLQDVAKLSDGAQEPTTDTWIQSTDDSQPHPAVFLSVAKQKGANAVSVAEDVTATLNHLVDTQFPEGVSVEIIRNYGQTADAKVKNLVSSLGIAVLTVVVFVGLFLNWRSALVVAIAIPISYGAALGLDLAFGYSINRVTLFALILALGLIVDDPIASIDNIERHLTHDNKPRGRTIVLAMLEIKRALIMSTVAIVIVFTPMFFITGMMGPYMAPLAFNVPVSVVISTLVAFLVTPWLAKKIVRASNKGDDYRLETTPLYRGYRRVLLPLLENNRRAKAFLWIVGVLFVIAALLPALRLVPLKLLPYDNKNEFQVVLDLPETANHVDTSNALREMNGYLQTQAEVVSVSGFAGLASPMDFNGMVRHYFTRHAPYQGELRVVLVDKHRRTLQSHGLVTRMRDELEAIASKYDAEVQLVEMPPGPPVLATIVAEVYGSPSTPYSTLQAQATQVAERLKREALVSEVSTSVQGPLSSWQFVVDQEKAALSGVAVADINQALRAANQGVTLAHLADADEMDPLPVTLQLAADARDQLDTLLALHVRGRAGVAKQSVQGALVDAPQPLVALIELGHFERQPVDQPIYHKNLRPVVYVYAEPTGRVPGEVVADMMADFNQPESDSTRPLSARSYLDNGAGDGWQVDEGIEVVWSGEGEWKITIDVFRDLGIAYGAALLGVFIVMLIQTGLPAVSGIIMLAIPLTVIGIMPGFWLLNGLSGQISGYPNPALFTATAMIGMIALAGIVVRNSLVLIEFIQQSLAQGMALSEALVQAGAVRMRPILLTAGTTLLGNVIITLDPIFNGLAWAIIFGIAASTVFTLLVVPVVYNLAYQNHPTHGLSVEGEHA